MAIALVSNLLLVVRDMFLRGLQKVDDEGPVHEGTLAESSTPPAIGHAPDTT